ncbi:hypothetical protein Nepgr_029087 [Nepenthes gracilis]|uniref:Uncharacterized protein n=1 Tax=Nepenthes gracilis TaxID=150966 RepID=A0AAD3TE39_NEPGR|nr:hypothetical protein Nepgr_029087 [Nepenthes gracilis]
MKEYPTPQRDLSNRRSKESSSKSTADHGKKPQKIINKSLKSAFASVNGDTASESTSESFDNFSTISEVLDGEFKRQSVESSVVALNQPISAYSETLTPSVLTPSSEDTPDNNELWNETVDRDKTFQFCSSKKIGLLEAKVVAYHLKQARIEVSSNKNVHPGTKKLLDALIDVVMKEFYSLPDENERDQIDKLISARAFAIVVCFLLWIVSAMLLFGSGSQSSPHPPPT